MDYNKELEKVRRHLRIAYTKLLMARRMVQDKRLRKNMLFASALIGSVMTTPEVMSAIYFKSSLSEVKKARKKLSKLAKHRDMDEVRRGLIQEVIKVLEDAEKCDYNMLTKKIMDAEGLLSHLSTLEEGIF